MNLFGTEASRIEKASPDPRGSEARRSRWVPIAALATLAVLIVATSATAFERHDFLQAFGPDGTEGTTFARPGSLATDADGYVYLAEAEADTLEKFDGEGNPVDFSAIGDNAIGGIQFRGGRNESQATVASTGEIYATSLNSVLAFDAAGEPLPFSAGTNPGTNEISGFAELLGVAVDVSGAIYAADYSGTSGEVSGGAVSVYAPTGEPLTSFPSAQAGTLAVAADGTVYVSPYSGAVRKYEPSVFPVTAATTYTQVAEFGAGKSYGVAVNPASGAIYVNEGTAISQYDEAGQKLGASGAEGPGQLVESVGVAGFGTGSAERLYAADREGLKQVEIFGPALTLPDATTGDAGEVTNTSAKVAGLVNPAGTDASFQFEYGLSTNYGAVAPASPTPVGNDNSDHPVETELTGLSPNTTYHYRLVGINPDGTNFGEDRTFHTPGPADAETTGAVVRTATTALLEARVNPQGKPATYYFEYGPAGSCPGSGCQQTEAKPAGEGDEFVLVAERLTGLSPSSSFNYRIVAENGNVAGATIGAFFTVETRADDDPPPSPAFPGPPGSDRAWEQVSAPDSGGHAITEVKAISADGDRVVYNAKGGLPIGNLGTLMTPFLAERTASSWVTKVITPPQVAGAGRDIGWEQVMGDEELSKVVGVRQREGSKSLWAMAGNQSDRLFEVNIGEGEGEAENGVGFFSVSASGNRVVAAREDDSPQQMYDVTSGTPQVISLLPDGEEPACGVAAGGSGIEAAFRLPGSEYLSSANSGWLAADGSLAYFPSEGNVCNRRPQLYVRDLLGGETERISPSPISGPECAVAFVKSNDHGAYFWTAGRLTNDDQAVKNCPADESGQGGDIYRYDLGAEEVECLTCVNPDRPANVELIFGRYSGIQSVGLPRNGSRLYFGSRSKLLPGASQNGLYRLDVDSRELRFIAPYPPGSNNGPVGEAPSSGLAMSKDGSAIVFSSDYPELNARGGLSNGGMRQYYLYDDDSLALTCVSCPQDGSEPSGGVASSYGYGVLLMTQSNSVGGPNLTPISSDGAVFAFNTPSALVEDDINTAKPAQPQAAGTDAYEWRDGRLLLVSDGRSSWLGNSESARPGVAGVSQSGTDVYFTVAAQLTPDALDTAPRLYDARLQGGFAFPEAAAPCPLEVCQGTPPLPPVQPTPGSAELQGAGNVKPGLRCPKNKRKVKRKGKVRCVRKKAQQTKGHDRPAGADAKKGGAK